LDDIDFELELIHRDEINLSYILKLLAGLKNATGDDEVRRRKEIVELVSGDSGLRSKRELIEKFIRENLPAIESADDIPDEFDRFWSAEQQAAFEKLCAEEDLDRDRTEQLVEQYLFAEQEPLREELIALINGEKPGILHRKEAAGRILRKISDFLATFERN
jgi:type I restriction enzyme, R subunit